MTQREVKRPYAGSQPHITSYFPQHSQSQEAPPTYSISHTHNLSIDTTHLPFLPDTIQSDLLTVGMRVRKSVPEGYKTSTEFAGFNLFNESKSLPATPTTESPRTALKTRPRANAGARELMPFCGLLKVGGMRSQAQQAWGIYSPTHERSWSRYDCHSVDMVPDEDDVPVLSQGGSVSVAGTPNGNKRRCEWDDSGDDDEMDVEVKMNVSLGFMNRPMAVPRRRTQQGNGQREVTRVFGEDFEEAEFLDLGLQGEVEMGGV